MPKGIWARNSSTDRPLRDPGCESSVMHTF